MRWKGRRKSSNIVDMRGKGGKIAAGGGIGGIVLLVLYLLFGGDPEQVDVRDYIGNGSAQTENYTPTAEEEELAQMIAVVLGDTEDVWNTIFAENGQDYIEPKLAYFTQYVQSACGNATKATGPFYCPADQQIYIDLSFYQQLKNDLNAPGDFAMAYVLAHEVGHHVQNLLGISDQVQRQRAQLSTSEYNALSVRLELQADFLAGLWAHHAEDEFNLLEEGDIEEALNAANAIGDDRLQKKSQGYIVPDAFTHGTSAQRVHWFKKGYQSGKLEAGDTFAIENL